MESLILLVVLTANPYDHMADTPKKIPGKSAILAKYDFMNEETPKEPEKPKQSQQQKKAASESESKGLFRSEGIIRRLFNRERRGLFRGLLRCRN
tara:strand:+ start:2872 stop:3156 length:285 start_codon:yes stop_codon:yes gene_type:complete